MKVTNGAPATTHSAPVLQLWLPCDDARAHLGWVCQFVAERRTSIMLLGCPGGATVILDPPHTIYGVEKVRVAVGEAQENWATLLERISVDDAVVLEIVAGNGSRALLSRWECDPLLRLQLDGAIETAPS